MKNMKIIKSSDDLNVISVNDLPFSERPRERLREFGAEKLSSAELLTLLINTGTKGESVIRRKIISVS